MGQLTNLYVSESYQGLIKLANSTTGVTGTLQYLQDGLGNRLPIQMSTSSVNITGSLFGTSSYATQALSASYAPDNSNRNGLITTGSAGGSQSITGSLGITDIKGTGSLFLQPNQGDVRYLEIYNTSPTDTHITASGGQIFLGDDQTYVKVDNYGSVERIDVVAGNELNVSSSLVNLTGSLHQSGTFYPDVIDWFSSSILQSTGSYILTTNISGVTEYDSYQNVASALQQYINTGSIPSGTVSGSAQIVELGFATTGSNVFQGLQTISGSLIVTGSITALSASITYLQTVYQTSSIIFSSGSNILGDEAGDTQTLNGQVNIPLGNLNITGATTSSLGFFGNLQGTASFATNALSASQAQNAVSASFSQNTISGSFSNFAVSSSYSNFALSSSQAQNAVTASFLLGTIASASFAENANTASLAKDVFIVAKNTTGGQLTKGTVVRINGSTGDQALIVTASWENDGNSANTLGILPQNIANDATGSVITTGTLLGINTNGMTAGDILYLSSSGQYTNVKPPAPYHEVRLGQVLRVQQINGSMYVAIQNGYELDEIHDVDITSPVDGDLLVYRSGSYGQWVNETGPELGYAITGSNTFKGVQDISGSLNMTPNSVLTLQTGSSMRVIGDATGGPGNIGFFENSTTTRSFNIQPQPGGNGTVAFSDFPTNNHFMFYNLPLHWIQFEAPLTSTGSGNAIDVLYGMNIGMNQTSSAMGLKVTGSLNVTGSQHRIIGSTVITGSVILSGSAGPELDVKGDVLITGSVILSGSAGVELDVKGEQTNTGSLNILGSINLRGDQTISGSLITNTLNDGMIFINSEAYNSGSVKSSISASAAISSSNIFFGNATGPAAANLTGSIVISGSNNIFMGGPRPSTITSGTYGYLGGSTNIMMGQSTLTTSSILRPTMTTNINVGSFAMTFTTSSLAAPTLTSNLNIGTTNLNHQSASINYNTNINVGTVTSTANNIALPFLTTIQQNYFGGSALTLNHNSSSITTANNIIGGGAFTVTNLVSSSVSATNNGLTLSNNLVMGSANGVWVSGSNTTNRRQVISNIIGGTNTAVSSSQVGSDSSNLVSSIVYGQNLIVSASHATNVGGSTFVGRYNDTGSLALSQDIVFAVGTGTGTTTRRTGLYVTSGSLAVVSGSFEVKGGSTIITGSVQGNVLPLTVTSNTASLDLNNGNFFELALTGSQNIFINPSNIKPGQTINIKLNTTGSGTVTFPTSVKQPSGSAYTPTTTVGTDIITMVSFDSTNLFVANVKNLI